MGRKNYLRDMKFCRREEQKHNVGWREYVQAVLGFLRKPKTRFDLLDRVVF